MRRSEFINNIKPEFNVIIYDPNTDQMKPYNIIPYFVNEYKNTKRNKPKTFEDFKNFVIQKSMYMFWSRCEYEIMVEDWPSQLTKEKWDIHRQILMNIEIITMIIYRTVKYK